VAIKQYDRIKEATRGPGDGGEELRHADAAITVAINQSEGLFVEFEAPDGATQRDPELLVELRESLQIGSSRQRDLIKSPGAEEFPRVNGGGIVHSANQ
jgi:hypothetical protein